MKLGDIMLVTRSELILSLGYSGVVRPGEVEDGDISKASAVLLDETMDQEMRAPIERRCLKLGVPVMVVPDVSVGEGDAQDAMMSVTGFLRNYHRLTHTVKLAPENYAKIEMQTLVDIITTTNSLLKPREVMESVMNQINELIACEAWSVLIVDEDDSQYLSFAAANGPSNESLFSVRIPIGEGIAGWVAQNSQPLIVNDVRKDPRFLDKVDKNTNFTTVSVLCAPLISRGRTIGVIEMINRCNSYGFSEADLELVEILVNPAAVAIENAFLFQRAEMLTILDDLTKLYNSRYLNKCLDFELQRAKRLKQPLAVLFLDLDGFKSINDRFGHLQGSRSLIDVGSIIKLAARETDIVGRYGGDEFMLILPATGPEGARQVAERICSHVAQYRLHDLNLSASIGIASFPEHGREKNSLVRLADKAMYWVKDHGKNGIAVADKFVAT